jgi:hypothetical protein
MSSSPSVDQQLQESVSYALGDCPAPKVREIHIDFLLEEEFTVNQSFLEHFIGAYKNHGGSCRVVSVERSVADQFGEADVLVLYKQSEGDDNCTAILIEDKIGAGFQPGQPERYRERGEHGLLQKSQKSWKEYWTCLVAPQSYITEEARDGFDAVITLEKIKEWMAPTDSARHSFKARVIQDAIDKADRPGPQEIDEQVTQFRASYFCLLGTFFADRSQQVYMRPPKPSWKGEVWFRIKSSLLRNGAYIHHKAPNGFVDLTFPDTDGRRLNAAGALLEKGMTIEQTGKSSAIRLRVTAITQFDNFERERVSVEEAFASVERLLSFYMRQQTHLDPILMSAATAPVK